MKKKLIILTPLILFAGLVWLLIQGLDNAANIKDVPSPLIGKTAPDFTLPRLEDESLTFSPKDMLGKVWLLNIWASWCPSCRVEHNYIKYLASLDGLEVVGLNWRDERPDALQWLRQLGDPYMTNAYDHDNTAGIDWGVYGAPESFLVDKKGVIRHKVIGAISPENLKADLLPLIQQLNAE